MIAETQKRARQGAGGNGFPLTARIFICLVRPEAGLHPSEVSPLTFISCLAVFDALQERGLKPTLKWPNDVLVNGRKICGTLLELSAEADMVRFVVVGIGLNVNMEESDMDDEIRAKARRFFSRQEIALKGRAFVACY